ncbi:protein-serine/threonine phosphatase PphC [soil metagenome]
MTWSVLADSVIGTSHRRLGTPCQDAYAAKVFGTDRDRLVLVVADGAGSARHAEIGSRLACDSLASRVHSLNDGPAPTVDWLTKTIADVRDELASEAERLNACLRDLACTLLVVVAWPDEALIAQIGDGAIVWRSGEEFQLAFWPARGEYANETHFLTQEDFVAALTIRREPSALQEVALLSDGLQIVALDYALKAPHLPFFEPLLKWMASAEDMTALQQPFRTFLEWDRFDSHTDDDKTLLLACRQP